MIKSLKISAKIYSQLTFFKTGKKNPFGDRSIKFSKYLGIEIHV